MEVSENKLQSALLISFENYVKENSY